ncbi:MAG: hypothetical protein DYH12_20100, partial [Sorangiineae bacterium PRO1]|nr:hypothetical protein [Sorangiineae bacterium PRO1]
PPPQGAYGYGGPPPAGQAPPPAAPPPDPGVHTHDGFYLRMGLGVGSLSGTVEQDAGIGTVDIDASGIGPAVELALGGTVAPGIVIGGGIYGTSIAKVKYEYQNQSSDGGQGVASMIGPFIDYYFDPNGGFHAQAAIGITAITSQKSDDLASDPYPSEDSSGTGSGLMLGVGYEAWVGEQWGIGGLARLQYFSGEVEGDDSGDKADVSGTVIAVLFTATLH